MPAPELRPSPRRWEVEQPPVLGEREFVALCALLERHTGITPRPDRKQLFAARLLRRLRERRTERSSHAPMTKHATSAASTTSSTPRTITVASASVRALSSSASPPSPPCRRWCGAC